MVNQQGSEEKPLSLNDLGAPRGPAKLLISLDILCEKVVDILGLFVYYLKHDEETRHTHNQTT